MRQEAIHSIPMSGTRFGIVFATRAQATRFPDTMRADPFTYEPVGTATKVRLRVGPPKDADTKAKGLLLTKVYSAIDVGAYKMWLRPSYPRVGDRGAELAIPLPSGKLRDVATVRFGKHNDEWRIRAIGVSDEIFADSAILNSIMDETGITPLQASKAQSGSGRGAEGPAPAS